MSENATSHLFTLTCSTSESDDRLSIRAQESNRTPIDVRCSSEFRCIRPILDLLYPLQSVANLRQINPEKVLLLKFLL